MSAPDDAVRAAFARRVAECRDGVVALAAALVAIDSQNPPGDTSRMAEAIEKLLGDVPGFTLRRVVGKEPAVNLVARLQGSGPGRRLVYNGHLDTFPVGDPAGWTVPPFGGVVRDGRLYGRGVSDMKAGLAASLTAAALLAEFRQHWAGEVVLTLVADEEAGGVWGTQHVLATVPEATGDAMLNGDAGSPGVIRIGEKGYLWAELQATGKAGHGAHVHLGVNAVDRLSEALHRVRRLRQMPCPVPDNIRAVVAAARPVSEPISGAGESEVLTSVTVNVGRIEGGSSVNLIPDAARALVDIRLPWGVEVATAASALDAICREVPGTSWRALGSYEPNVTDPAHEIVGLALASARRAVSPETVVNMRIGISDARLYRGAGVPSVVYGPTPHNMGGPDEHVTLADLHAVFAVHALTGFDFLRAG